MTAKQELLFSPVMKGPLTTLAGSASNQFAGRTSMNSGDTTVTVSTTTVASDDLIKYGWQSAVDSNVAQDIKVNTISPGNHFGFTVTPAPVGIDFNIMWSLEKTS